jgi:hypothetical protein
MGYPLMHYSEWEHIEFLEYEIVYLESLLGPSDTGHIRTAISVLRDHLALLRVSIDDC